MIYDPPFPRALSRLSRLSRLVTSLLTLAIALLAAVPHPARADSPPIRLIDEHTDLRVLFQPDLASPLEIVAYASDRALALRSNQVVLVALESAQLTLPSDFPPLGQAGDRLWILPQSQNPSLLYLGFSGEALPLGLFDGQLTLHLRALQGPGHVFIWQATQFGALEMRVNSRDGLSSDDAIRVFPGGHDHYNFGFTSNGVYHLTLQAEGTLANSGERLLSAPTPFTVEVEPLPDLPPRLALLQPDPGGPFSLTFTSRAGQVFTLERSRDLVTWTPLTQLTATSPVTTLSLPLESLEPSPAFLRTRSP